MKNSFLLIFLFWFSSAFAQNTNCRLSKEKLNELCERYEKKNINYTQLKEIAFFVSPKKAGELEAIREWANKNGYTTEESYDTEVDTAIAIKKKVDVFSCTIYNIIYNHIEHALDKMNIGCFIVKPDTCEGYMKQNLINFYNGYILYPRIKADTIYFQPFFEFDLTSNKKMQGLNNWAKENGYTTKEKAIADTLESGEVINYNLLFIERILGKWEQDYFVEEMLKIAAIKKELKITQCRGSGMQIGGKSILTYVK